MKKQKQLIKGNEILLQTVFIRILISINSMIYLTTVVFLLENTQKRIYQSFESFLIIIVSVLIAYLSDKFLKRVPITVLSISSTVLFFLFLVTKNVYVLLAVSASLLPIKSLMDAQINKERGSKSFILTKSMSNIATGFLIFILGIFHFSANQLIICFCLLQLVFITLSFGIPKDRDIHVVKVKIKEIYSEIQSILPLLLFISILNIANQFTKFTPHFFSQSKVMIIAGSVAFMEGILFVVFRHINVTKKHLLVSLVSYGCFGVSIIFYYNTGSFFYLFLLAVFSSLGFVLYTIIIKKQLQNKTYTTNILVDIFQTVVVVVVLNIFIY